MALLSSFNEDRAVSCFRGYSIYCATIVTMGYAVGVVLTTLLEGLMANFIFFPNTAFFRGQVWQIFFCTFVNRPSFFILFGLFFLYVSAVEVEKYIGRSRFLVLYGILLFAPIFTLTAWMFATGQSAPYFGNIEVAIGFFIAFCTLYPSFLWFGMSSRMCIVLLSYALCPLVLLFQH